jgi:hypothetical protein
MKREPFISSMAPANLRTLSNPEFDQHLHDIDDPTCFTFSDLDGVVPARTLPASTTPGAGYQSTTVPNATGSWDRSREPKQIRIFFKPKQQGKYHSRFRFQVTCGDPIDIELHGTGTVDEQHLP